MLGDDYIYNLSWEDPVVDHKVLGLGKDDVICMVSTSVLSHERKGRR